MSKVRLAGLVLVGALAIAAPFVQGWEGREHVAYLDAVGVPTICDGVTRGVKLGMVATDAECDKHLVAELSIAASAVDRGVKVKIPDTLRAALISFVYNVGETNFRSSTLLRKLNAGDMRGACNELPRWVYAKGRKLRGLVLRRGAERELCLRGI